MNPVAYINVEERKLEWAEPITWHTPTIAKMDKIPLYAHPVKELTERIRKLETALQGWEIGFEKMGYERLLKDKDEYIAELLKEPIKELTDEEIRECIHQIDPNKTDMFMSFARAILLKSQEK